MRVTRPALALLCAAALLGSKGVRAQPPSAEDLGLGPAFVAEAQVQMRAMGFGGAAVFVDLSNPGLVEPQVLREAQLSPSSSLFAIVGGSGASSRCWVVLRPALAIGSPESQLARAMEETGVDRKVAWRSMARHELGHCVLARVAPRQIAAETWLSEPFADVFALDWSARVEPTQAPLAAGLERARRLMGSGPHATASEIARWRGSSPVPSPCLAGWQAVPAASRPAVLGCPASALRARVPEARK